MALVERGEELHVLEESLAGCMAGGGRVMIVSGPVGSGKTELLRTFAQRAVEDGATFLNANASRVESALPLGVVGQLFVGTKLPAGQTDRAARLLEDGALTAMLHEPEPEATARVTAPVLSGLTGILLDLSRRGPLLIGVDDVHFADVASLQFLLYLVRRVSQAPVLMVLTETLRTRQPHPVFRADLVSQPHCRQVRLKLLSRCGVAAVLRDRLRLRETYRLASASYQLSGGNPMLLNALIQDTGLGGDPEALAVGDTFCQAVLSCLYRSDATVLRLARVIAVLGEPAPHALIGELLGLDVESTTRAIRTATKIGLLDEGQFRHARVRAAVLDGMTAEERAALCERTARALHASGAAPVAVARYAIAANAADASWSVPVLREAAENALEEDDTALALDCCRRAERAGLNETERVAITALLARIQWRLDPAAADRPVADLVMDARAGRLTRRERVSLINYLLWQGRSEEAVELLDRFSATTDPGDVDTAIELYLTRLRLCYAFPGLSARIRTGRVAPQPGAVDAAKWTLQLQTGRIFETLLDGGSVGDLPVAAEHVLQNVRVGEGGLALSLTCLEALVVADCLDRAAYWCDSLLREASARRAPVWQALYSHIRAMISFRQGDLHAAEQYARTALTRISPKSWGVLVGGPLSTLVLAMARKGTYEDALTHLDVRVPEVMFETRYGLQYLRARGRYYLARGYWQPAVMVFDACREQMDRWGLDLPGLVPWRSDMAEAYIGLGQRAQARALLHDQLARLGSGNDRTRGISLRVLAAAEPEHRLALLQQAVEVLRASGDQLELADALTELSDAQQASGEYIQVRPAIRRTPRLAAGGWAEVVRPAQSRDGTGAPVTAAMPRFGAEANRISELSDAERRVAALAALGHTNRQIARALYVTVSTVEQHLTRVYRKLEVSRRADLPSGLVAELRDSA
jgi:DNA-binding CsgD family transcriptional regulator